MYNLQLYPFMDGISVLLLLLKLIMQQITLFYLLIIHAISWYTFFWCYCSSIVADYILNDFYGSQISSD